MSEKSSGSGLSNLQPTSADRAALERCYECFDDGQDTDIGIPMLARLVAIGWLDKIGHTRWQINGEGEAVLSNSGSHP